MLLEAGGISHWLNDAMIYSVPEEMTSQSTLRPYAGVIHEITVPDLLPAFDLVAA